MSNPNRNINSRDFFSDENMEAIAEPASYGDWAPANGEVTRSDGTAIPGRPDGDSSSLPFGVGVEIVHTKG